ncbi:MAG: cation transporter [Anaerolineales bacterium]
MEHHGNCHVEAVEKVATEHERSNLIETRLAIWGMGCPNCSMRVRNALLQQSGVVDAHVDHQSGAAMVRHNPDMVTLAALLGAGAGAGNGHHQYRAALA